MRKAFTLIELLVVIAIIAILAAILFPVFAQAKASAKKTASISGLKQVALGLPMYSVDYDDIAVPEYGYGTPTQPDAYLNGNTWVGRIYPYVKNRGIFFDKLMNEPKGDLFPDPFFPGYTYRWEWITNFSLNTDGYSRRFSGDSCNNISWTTTGYRSLTSFDDSAARLAVAVTRYANLDYAWMRFYGIDASWPTIDRYATGWSWYQVIWDSRRQWGNRFTGAFADGHAGKYGREKFVGYYADNPSQSEATTYAQYCQRMDDKNLWSFWGRPWAE
ncbi:MAG: prepilin-type N-terminal cleavage/methylation domain-containing protein [Fimbriimonadaceae bacterium]|nr:prepilin-type N-terminal cleavage/methylation domain-containing protein [Fimbriimonadaceae bacterium]